MRTRKYLYVANLRDNIICILIIVANIFIWFFIFFPSIKAFFPFWFEILITILGLSVWCAFPLFIILYAPIRIVYKQNESLVFVAFLRKKIVINFVDITFCKVDFYVFCKIKPDLTIMFVLKRIIKFCKS